jgi:hypothetical protein
MKAEAICFPAAMLFALASASAAGPPTPLDKLIEVGKRADAPFKDVLQFLQDRCDAKITIDEDAFKKVGLDKNQIVTLPRMYGVPLALALEVTVCQVGGTVRVERDRVTIVPGKRASAEVLGPPGEKLKKKLAEKIELPMKTDEIPLEFAMDYLSEKADVTIFIAGGWQPTIVRTNGEAASEEKVTTAMRRRFRVELPTAERPCQLEAGTQTLQAWLNQATQQTRCKSVPRGELILIVPLDPNNAK